MSKESREKYIKENYTEKSAKTIQDLFQKETLYRTDDELKDYAEKEIFSNPNFQNDLQKTIEELEKEYGSKVVEKVVKHYILSVIKFMYKVHDYTISISIVGAFSIMVPNNVFSRNSKYYFRKHRTLLKFHLLRFQKNKKHLILKTDKYEQSKF